MVNALSLEDIVFACSVGSSSPINFLVDSGADVNVIGGNDWTQLKREAQTGIAVLEFIDEPFKKLHAYGSYNPMIVECTIKAEISIIGSTKSGIQAVFHVVPKGARSLLGRSTSSDMGLLHVGSKINCCEKMSAEETFPKMPGVKVKFSIDQTVPPMKTAYYNIPAAYR